MFQLIKKVIKKNIIKNELSTVAGKWKSGPESIICYGTNQSSRTD